jgi:myo-inositol-1(or 4)-monophosphatase
VVAGAAAVVVVAAAAETTAERGRLMEDPTELIARIRAALAVAAQIFADADGRSSSVRTKSRGDPVTEIDLALDVALKASLIRPGEGWLSEETIDDPTRLDRDLVWVVDPLDGTREFVQGIPEYCTSIAAVIDGHPVAGGVLNPAAHMEIVGGLGEGISMNGVPLEDMGEPTGPLRSVLASRSEYERGQWTSIEAAGLEVVPMGSVAYKMARVAAGLDDLTWTPVPKHEWDVAGGAALLSAVGGRATGLDGQLLRFNQARPWFSGVIALRPGLETQVDTVMRFVDLQRDL